MTEAEVTSVSDYPVSDNAQAYGTNPNTSNYPFTAVLTDAGGFKNNQPVNVSITADAGLSSQALYIPKAYVREDNGEYYVFIADEKAFRHAALQYRFRFPELSPAAKADRP